jgi:hypothetical protein
MGQAKKVCRTCDSFLRGKGDREKWTPTYGRCIKDGEVSPTHANSRACPGYVAVEEVELCNAGNVV